ncbi:nuclear transcription factor Y subunit B-10-like protein isoform X1 [Tanacetum coccineum]
MRNIGRPNNKELGYIDAEVPKYVNKEGGQRESKIGIVKKPSIQSNFPNTLMHSIILVRQNGMHLLWDMKLITKSVKYFLGKNTPNICNGTRDGRKEFNNLTWKLEILRRTEAKSKLLEAAKLHTHIGQVTNVKRKTINGDDLLWAMATLGFEDYIDPLKAYLSRYREVTFLYELFGLWIFILWPLKGDTKGSAKGQDGSASKNGFQPHHHAQLSQGLYSKCLNLNYGSSQENVFFDELFVQRVNTIAYMRGIIKKMHGLSACSTSNGPDAWKGLAFQMTFLEDCCDKYEYEKRKKEKLEEVKARLDFGDARKKSTRAQELAYSESRTISL